MNPFFIITQVDTDADGYVNTNTGVWQDDDGKTEQFKTGDAAKAAILDHIRNNWPIDKIAPNDELYIAPATVDEAVKRIDERLLPQSGQYVWINNGGYIQTLTINQINL